MGDEAERSLGLLITSSDEDPVWGVVADWFWEQGHPMAEFLHYQSDVCQLDRDDLSPQFLMRYCLPGTFLMGSPEDEPGRGEDKSQHEVILAHGFWLGPYPVTQSEYTSVMGTNPGWFSLSGRGRDDVRDQDSRRELVHLRRGLSVGPPQRGHAHAPKRRIGLPRRRRSVG